jgi:hypothetical protein
MRPVPPIHTVARCRISGSSLEAAATATTHLKWSLAVTAGRRDIGAGVAGAVVAPVVPRYSAAGPEVESAAGGELATIVAATARPTEPPMPFMLLIIETPGQRQQRTEAEGRDLYGRMVAFSEALESRGVLRASHSLTTDTDGVRVSVRDGKTSLVDGPFSEAKEMVGGYFIVDVATRDEAVAIARDVPAAQWATVEVREFGPCFM